MATLYIGHKSFIITIGSRGYVSLFWLTSFYKWFHGLERDCHMTKTLHSAGRHNVKSLPVSGMLDKDLWRDEMFLFISSRLWTQPTSRSIWPQMTSIKWLHGHTLFSSEQKRFQLSIKFLKTFLKHETQFSKTITKTWIKDLSIPWLMFSAINTSPQPLIIKCSNSVSHYKDKRKGAWSIPY